jgi:hypothetical protein
MHYCISQVKLDLEQTVDSSNNFVIRNKEGTRCETQMPKKDPPASVNSVGLEQIDEAAMNVKSCLKVDNGLLYRTVSL